VGPKAGLDALKKELNNNVAIQPAKTVALLLGYGKTTN